MASDWANNTGQGVDNPGEFELAVLKRCTYYRELEPIMGDRPNAKPLATSEDNDDLIVQDEDELSAIADTAAIESLNTSTAETPKASVSSISSSASSKRRITAAAATKRSKNSNKNNVDDLVSAYLGVDESDGEGNNNSFKKLCVREVEAREQEASARMLEAQAVSKKAESETSILAIQAGATLLRERKKLLEEGICQEDIDMLLPLKK